MAELTADQVRRVADLIQEARARGNLAEANHFLGRLAQDVGGDEKADQLVRDYVGPTWDDPDLAPAGVDEVSRPFSDYWTALKTGAVQGLREIGRGLERATFAGGGGSPGGVTFTDPIGAAAEAAEAPSTWDDLEALRVQQEAERAQEAAAMPPVAQELPGYVSAGSTMVTAPAYMLPGRMATLPAQVGLSAVEGALREDQSVLGNVVGTVAGHTLGRMITAPLSRQVDPGAITEFERLRTVPAADLPPTGSAGGHWQLRDLLRPVPPGMSREEAVAHAARSRAMQDTLESGGYRGAPTSVPSRVRRMELRGDWVPPGFRTGDSKQVEIDRAIARNIDTSHIPLSRINQNQINLNRTAGRLAGMESPPPSYTLPELHAHERSLQRVKDPIIRNAPARMQEADLQALGALRRNLEDQHAYTGMNSIHDQITRGSTATRGNRRVFRQPSSSWVHGMRQNIKDIVDRSTGADRARASSYLDRFDEIFERGLSPEDLATYNRAKTNQFWTLKLMEKDVLDSEGNVIASKMRDTFFQPSGQALLYDQRMVDRASQLYPDAFQQFDDLTWLGKELSKPPKLSATQRWGHTLNPLKKRAWAIDPGTVDPVKSHVPRRQQILYDLYASGYPQVYGYAGLPQALPEIAAPLAGVAGREAAVRFEEGVLEPVQDWLMQQYDALWPGQ